MSRVCGESSATVLPSWATTDPPYDHSTPVQLLLASLDDWLMAMPIGLPLFLSSVPALSKSSHVSTGARPLASKMSLRYSAGKSTKYSGKACHEPSNSPRVSPSGIQPPWASPTCVARSPTSTIWIPLGETLGL